jgi:hypothetical protein
LRFLKRRHLHGCQVVAPYDFPDTVGGENPPAAHANGEAGAQNAQHQLSPHLVTTQAELRTQMLDLMQQLVGQGLTVREIAARCGLSEAEAELMLSLRGSQP